MIVNNCLCCIFVLVFIVAFCDGYQVGKGKYESYNGNRNTELKSMNINDTKFFFNRNRNKPPSHDTPAAPCSCSE